jgi:hypothetical protein
MTDAE